MMELLNEVDAILLAVAASPWLVLGIFLLSLVDGIFPPVPSESLIIAAAVLVAAGDGPSLWALIPAAAAGAFLGDNLAFTVGRRVPLGRLARSRRATQLLTRTTAALRQRGTPLILSARFVPGGRVAVNLSAGALGFPRRRFVAVSAVAAVSWAAYSALLGLGAGEVLHARPALAVAVGVVGGVLVGLVLDALIKRLPARLGGLRKKRADAAGPGLVADRDAAAEAAACAPPR